MRKLFCIALLLLLAGCAKDSPVKYDALIQGAMVGKTFEELGEIEAVLVDMLGEDNVGVTHFSNHDPLYWEFVRGEKGE